MQQSSSAAESEASHPSTIEVSVMPRRAWLGVVGLVVLTVGSLGFAWLLPDRTLLHFVWVAQAVPLLYFLLAWWGTQASHPSDDVS